MKKLILMGLFVIALSGSTLAQAGLSRQQIQEIAQSVVQIVALQRGRPLGTGSGTIIDATGLIFTNRHVVEDADDYAILMLEDLREPPVHRYYASLVGVADTLDFAALQIDRDENGRTIDTSALSLPFIQNANEDVLHGDTVYIFGYPGIGGGYLVVTQGVITTVENGTINGRRLPIWYQTDAEISPGNSGGLAVNQAGEFIGIPTAVQSEERTLGRLGGILPVSAIFAAFEDTSSAAATPTAPAKTPSAPVTGGVSVDCGRGVGFNNGVEVTVLQMRSGFNYTATAIGLNGFDPVLAVLDPSTGRGLCTDDEPAAARFQVALPTTGVVPPNSTTSRITFSQRSGRPFADVSLVVGGLGDMAGEFVLVLEGMAATAADNRGDPFSIRLTPGLVASGVPLTVYMISVTDALDPFMYLADSNLDVVVTDLGETIYCDDAGDPQSCWGQSASLSGSYVTRVRGTALPGGSLDAMLQIPLDGFDPTATSDLALTFVMTSYQQTSFGDYVVAIHAATQ